MNTIDILRNLIAFPTVSSDPNRDLMRYCEELLVDVGAKVQLIWNDEGTKANLYATIGPLDRPGVMLSGHTDVVPVTGQAWTKPPFEMTQADGKLFGRGTADMKGFVAAALNAAVLASKMELKTPLHLALSYDEEVGCLGVRSLIDMLRHAPHPPQFCIVGEPTGLAVATGHKGKTALSLTAKGREGHSALAPFALNAVHLASDMITEIRAIQHSIAAQGGQDEDFDVPYTTLHVGRIDGGVALNIVPNICRVAFEIRNLAEDNPDKIIQDLREAAQKILAPHLAQFPEADLIIEVTNRYPPLGTAPDAEVVRFVKSLTGANGTFKVAFGTEGGLFDQELGIPTVICGPGSMAQGHKPDEFVSEVQLKGCDAMLATLLGRLQSGL